MRTTRTSTLTTRRVANVPLTMSRTTGLLGVIAGVGVGVKLRWNVGRGCPAGGRRDEVLGLDLSERMLVVAIVKAAAARVAVQFPQGDAGLPPFERSSFDVGFRAPPPVGVTSVGRDTGPMDAAASRGRDPGARRGPLVHRRRNHRRAPTGPADVLPRAWGLGTGRWDTHKTLILIRPSLQVQRHQQFTASGRSPERHSRPTIR
jgi:Methyltransferase domain